MQRLCRLYSSCTAAYYPLTQQQCRTASLLVDCKQTQQHLLCGQYTYGQITWILVSCFGLQQLCMPKAVFLPMSMQTFYMPTWHSVRSSTLSLHHVHSKPTTPRSMQHMHHDQRGQHSGSMIDCVGETCMMHVHLLLQQGNPLKPTDRLVAAKSVGPSVLHIKCPPTTMRVSAA